MAISKTSEIIITGSIALLAVVVSGAQAYVAYTTGRDASDVAESKKTKTGIVKKRKICSSGSG